VEGPNAAAALAAACTLPLRVDVGSPDGISNLTTK